MAADNGSGRLKHSGPALCGWAPAAGKIKWQERNWPRAIVYSERLFEVRGHFLSRLLNEHVVCVLPRCKSLSASKSYFLPLHNNGGSEQCANMTRIQSLIMSSSLEVLTVEPRFLQSWHETASRKTIKYLESQLLPSQRLQNPLISTTIRVSFWTHLSIVWPEWASHRVLVSSLLVFIFFSAHHMFLTSRGDLLASFGYSFSVSKSPVSCRSKGQAGRKLQEQTSTASLQTVCKGARWDSRPTMCPRPMFTSSVEALPFPGPSQYFGAEKESVIWGLAVYCVRLWFMLRCTKSLVVNTPARASKLSRGFVWMTSRWYLACFSKDTSQIKVFYK